jgi:hypothetical protein
MAAEGTVAATGRASADLPYPPSWVDWLTRAIDRLPIPAWAFYGLLLGALVLVNNAMNWVIGAYPPWTFELFASRFLPAAVFALVMVQYLNRVAGSKLEAFRPALDVDEQEYQRLHHQLTTLPARETALVSLGGVAFVILLYATELPSEVLGKLSPAVLANVFILDVIPSVVLAVLIYHTIHQLRMVSRIHAMAPDIDLFEPAPLYAFSHLTARTGLGLFAITLYSYVVDPRIDVVGVFLTVVILGLAVAAFTLPLEGMHNRIVVEKYRLLLEANRRMKVTIARLHGSVDERDLSVADDLNKTLASLQLERDAIARMPTWPWEPGTFRAFVSVLLVPIVLWLIIRALERFV